MYYVRENLAVCGYHHIGNRESFQSHGFRVQLQCAEAYDAWLSECVEVLARPFQDGMPIPEDAFHPAQDWLAAHWDSGAKILISCAAGQSRSVTMAIALLARKAGPGFLEAAREVIRAVPGAYPHPHVLVSASAFCGQLLQLQELQDLYGSVAVPPRYPWSPELLQQAAAQQYVPLWSYR